jgi:hypothetical protein
VIADFIMEHAVVEKVVGVLEITPWDLFFSGYVCTS